MDKYKNANAYKKNDKDSYMSQKTNNKSIFNNYKKRKD